MPAEGEGVTDSDWDALYEWAAAHKPLCRFTFDLGFEDDDDDDYVVEDEPWFSRRVFDDIMQLRSKRPLLDVFRYRSPQHPDTFLEDF